MQYQHSPPDGDNTTRLNHTMKLIVFIKQSEQTHTLYKHHNTLNTRNHPLRIYCFPSTPDMNPAGGRCLTNKYPQRLWQRSAITQLFTARIKDVYLLITSPAQVTGDYIPPWHGPWQAVITSSPQQPLTYSQKKKPSQNILVWNTGRTRGLNTYSY